jgi:hypothetical protein
VAALEREVWRMRRERNVARALAGFSDPTADAQAPKAPVVDDPVFEAAVRDVMDRMDAEKSAERRTRQTDRIREMSERWADSGVDRAALTPEQKRRSRRSCASTSSR